jgi:hypothetical protein
MFWPNACRANVFWSMPLEQLNFGQMPLEQLNFGRMPLEQMSLVFRSKDVDIIPAHVNAFGDVVKHFLFNRGTPYSSN